jgi:hypothetical protein
MSTSIMLQNQLLVVAPMITTSQLAMTLFHVGIALATIYPRLPNDLPFPRSIGGDLSNPFRKILVFLTLMNVIRLVSLGDLRFDDDRSSFETAKTIFTGPQLKYLLFLATGAFESFLRSFLCLLTPFLCGASSRIESISPNQVEI